MITEKDVEQYTCGDCHILALSIHKRTGWPVCALEDEDGWANYHAFVKMPDGRFMDVRGPQTKVEIMQQWLEWYPEGVMEVTNLREFKDWHLFPDKDSERRSKRRANAIARFLLETFAPEAISQYA